MNENEIMMNEAMDSVPEAIAEKSGKGTGMALLIGGLIIAGVIAGGKLLMKVYQSKKDAANVVRVDFDHDQNDMEDPEDDK